MGGKPKNFPPGFYWSWPSVKPSLAMRSYTEDSTIIHQQTTTDHSKKKRGSRLETSLLICCRLYEPLPFLALTTLGLFSNLFALAMWFRCFTIYLLVEAEGIEPYRQESCKDSPLPIACPQWDTYRFLVFAKSTALLCSSIKSCSDFTWAAHWW